MANRTPRGDFEAFQRAIAKVSQIDWARLAAFIDGEGTIFIQGTKNDRKHDLTVLVANTDLRLMNWLVSTFTGPVYHSHSKSQREGTGNKVCMSWRMHSRRAEIVLLNCLPFFIIKREQADLGLAFCEHKRQGHKWMALTDEVIRTRMEFKDKMSALNSSPWLRKSHKRRLVAKSAEGIVIQ